MASPLNDRTPKKPANQGTAAQHHIKPPVTGGVITGGNTMGGLMTSSINKPGKGTNSSGAKNSPSRT